MRGSCGRTREGESLRLHGERDIEGDALFSFVNDGRSLDKTVAMKIGDVSLIINVKMALFLPGRLCVSCVRFVCLWS